MRNSKKDMKPGFWMKGSGVGGALSLILIPTFGVFKCVPATRRVHKLLVPEGGACEGKRIYKHCCDISFRGVLSGSKVVMDVYPDFPCGERCPLQCHLSASLQSPKVEEGLPSLIQSGWGER